MQSMRTMSDIERTTDSVVARPTSPALRPDGQALVAAPDDDGPAEDDGLAQADEKIPEVDGRLHFPEEDRGQDPQGHPADEDPPGDPDCVGDGDEERHGHGHGDEARDHQELLRNDPHRLEGVDLLEDGHGRELGGDGRPDLARQDDPGYQGHEFPDHGVPDQVGQIDVRPVKFELGGGGLGDGYADEEDKNAGDRERLVGHEKQLVPDLSGVDALPFSEIGTRVIDLAREEDKELADVLHLGEKRVGVRVEDPRRKAELVARAARHRGAPEEGLKRTLEPVADIRHSDIGDAAEIAQEGERRGVELLDVLEIDDDRPLLPPGLDLAESGRDLVDAEPPGQGNGLRRVLFQPRLLSSDAGYL